MTRLLRMLGWVAVGTLGAIGLVTAAPVTVPVALFAGALAGAAGYVTDVYHGEQDGARRSGPRPAWLRRVVRFATAGFCATAVVSGLVVLVGPVAAPVTLLGLAALAWRYRARLRGVADEPDTRASGPAGPGADVEHLTLLTGAELDREWRRSFGRLARVRDGAELGRVLALRRRQLDEMERRDPAGFRRWAGSGAWISGDRAPFLHRAARLDPGAGT